MKAFTLRNLPWWIGVAGLLAIGPLFFFNGRGGATPFTASPSVRSVVDGNTEFAVDLYHQLKAEPGNLFFSPQSISTAFAMTYAGARGDTASEMAKAFHFNLPQEDLHPAFGTLEQRIDKIQRRGITLKTANSVWCQKGYPIVESFRELIEQHYRADARLVDFAKAPDSAAGEIGDWIRRHTNGKIPGLGSAKIDHETRLVLCNAIYFKGTWQTQFQVRDTAPREFHVTREQSVTVPMMTQNAEFRVTGVGNIQLLELPYSGNDLSMVVLLPREVDGLADLEKQLTADDLRRWLAELDRATPGEILVGLPKFRAWTTLDLKPPLQGLGVHSLFRLNANLSGIDPQNLLFVSDATHQAFVDVNEEGTEAAAATIVVFAMKGMPSHFIANHPFLFLIRDRASGAILFLGRIVDPSR